MSRRAGVYAQLGEEVVRFLTGLQRYAGRR
jgi:hypothetical protein